MKGFRWSSRFILRYQVCGRRRSAEVRKTTVLCLVDMYAILGERFLPYLSKNLTQSQLKLVRRPNVSLCVTQRLR